MKQDIKKLKLNWMMQKKNLHTSDINFEKLDLQLSI